MWMSGVSRDDPLARHAPRRRQRPPAAYQPSIEQFHTDRKQKHPPVCSFAIAPKTLKMGASILNRDEP